LPFFSSKILVLNCRAHPIFTQAACKGYEEILKSLLRYSSARKRLQRYFKGTEHQFYLLRAKDFNQYKNYTNKNK